MKAYSQDLRERVVSARLCGEGASAVAAQFAISPATVRRYMKRHEAGLTLAAGRAPGKPSRLRPEQEEAFVALLHQGRDWTLEKMAQEWQQRSQRSGVWLPISTLHEQVKRLGGRYKKRAAPP